jgi:hypothetical protein
MEGMLQPSSATAFDAVASLVSLTVYVGAALIVLARRPRESHARVFLGVALASAVPYVTTALQWMRGNGVYTPLVVGLTAAAFTVGSVALFHFTQLFPWRRPWVQRHFLWIALAYCVLPWPVAFIAWVVAALLAPVALSGSIGAVSPDPMIGIVVLLMLPAIFVAGVVLPVGGVFSLFKSWQEAGVARYARARATTFWMLMSQMGGGVLAVVAVPLLQFGGVGAPWSTMIAALAYGFALILPLVYVRHVAIDALSTSASPE